MRRFNRHCRLSEMAVLAVLVAAIPAALSQDPAPAPTVPSQPPAAQPQPPPTPEDLGDSFFAHQRYQAAIEAYKKGPRDSAVLWNKTGIAYQMMFNLDDAMRCYKASLKIDPNNPRVYNNLGTVYDAQKQYRNAERMYRKSLKLAPNSPLVLNNLGSDQLARHMYKKGWESYKAALALDPNIFRENSSMARVTNPGSVEERGAMNYYMAKGCLRVGLTVRAIEYLRMALNEGFTNPKKIAADSELASLRGLPAFERLLAAQSNP